MLPTLESVGNCRPSTFARRSKDLTGHCMETMSLIQQCIPYGGWRGRNGGRCCCCFFRTDQHSHLQIRNRRTRSHVQMNHELIHRQFGSFVVQLEPAQDTEGTCGVVRIPHQRQTSQQRSLPEVIARPLSLLGICAKFCGQKWHRELLASTLGPFSWPRKKVYVPVVLEMLQETGT